MTIDPSGLRRLAAECVALVESEFGRHLDGSLHSLTELDAVCAELVDDGPLGDERLELWWRLIGAYTGEVVVRAHGGEWIADDDAQGGIALSVLGITAFPFATTLSVLEAESYKSLASFARALPVIAAQTSQTPRTSQSPQGSQ
jgi:hypothetical protein